LHSVLCRQAAAADTDLTGFCQYRIEMPVTGEFFTTTADATGPDRALGIADTAAPLNCSCSDHQVLHNKPCYKDGQDRQDNFNNRICLPEIGFILFILYILVKIRVTPSSH
jgi:hypothetical protein